MTEVGHPPERDPIVIGGVPRAGVRLLASILDGHPALSSGPELPFLLTMARQWDDIARTLGANHARHYGVAPESTRASFRASMLNIVAPRVERAGKRRFVWHSFGAAISLDVLAALFDEARFVLMMRDPRDVARSLLTCAWRNPRDGRPLPYTRDVGAAARLWVDFMETALRHAASLQSTGRLIVVRYEDLCSYPEATLARLGEFLREAPADARVSEASASSVTASLHDPHPPLRSGLLDARSVGRWRSALDASQVAIIERATAHLLPRFGYG